MVEIEDSYLFLFISGIFIPLFIFLIKMIVEQGKNAAKLEQFDEQLKDTKGHHTTIELIRQKLEDLENDIKYLFRIVKNRQGRRGDDRDGTYYPDGDIERHDS